MKLLIVRHGDPDYATDTLTETGKREAALAAGRISKLDVAAFYVSPLGRAQETALATLTAMNRTAETLDWLQEFPGRIFDEDIGRERVIWDWLPERWTAEPVYYDKDAWMHTPVMETAGVPETYEAVCAGLDALLAKHGYVRNGNLYRAERPNRDTIVLFCHMGVQSAMLGHLLGISPMVLWHGLFMAPGSVTTVVTEERRPGIAVFRISALGDISHLYAAGEAPSVAGRFCETYSCAEERHD